DASIRISVSQSGIFKRTLAGAEMVLFSDIHGIDINNFYEPIMALRRDNGRPIVMYYTRLEDGTRLAVLIAARVRRARPDASFDFRVEALLARFPWFAFEA
ncbi:MAG TPA: hypothetical protein VHN99_07050, partial [Deinococcales bacterium]|nr:hypothetical protein [Deinococcales bacterium]